MGAILLSAAMLLPVGQLPPPPLDDLGVESVTVANMSNRLLEMEADCPVALERERLPSGAKCYANYQAASKELDRIDKAARWMHSGHRDILDQWREQQIWRRDVWCNMAAITNDWYWHGNGLRLKLQDLRNQIGRVAYDKAMWPEPVVEWALSRWTPEHHSSVTCRRSK